MYPDAGYLVLHDRGDGGLYWLPFGDVAEHVVEFEVKPSGAGPLKKILAKVKRKHGILAGNIPHSPVVFLYKDCWELQIYIEVTCRGCQAWLRGLTRIDDETTIHKLADAAWDKTEDGASHNMEEYYNDSVMSDEEASRNYKNMMDKLGGDSRKPDDSSQA